MVRIKEEPVEVEVVYRTAESESEDDVNYYNAGSIRDQVQAAWHMDELDVKPKIEPIDSNRQPVESLDGDFVRVNYRPKWIELVKSTFRRPSMERACQLCEKIIEFASAAKLIKHYDDFHREEILSYSCKMCEFSAMKTQEIVDHSARKHRGRKKNYIEVKKTNDRHNVWIGDDELVHSFFVNVQKSGGKKQSQGSEPAIVESVNNNRRFGNQKSKAAYVECDICLKKMQKESMKKHKYEKHNNEGPKFECNICQKKFLFRGELNRHVKTHMDKSKRKKFECKICSKQFLNPYHLREHESVHSDDPFKCDICGKIFDQFNGMKSHILGMHLKEKPFECDLCSKTFSTPQMLRQHEFIHKKDTLPDDDPRIVRQRLMKSYVECEICFKKLKKISIRKHKLIHKSERPKLECNVCQKSFLYKETLNSHMITHVDPSKREKFECKICSKQFLWHYDLRYHEKIHSDDPFKCDICGKIFDQFKRIKSHILCTHVKAKPFKCGFCNRAFACSKSLKCHEADVHLKGKVSDDNPRMRYKRIYKIVECDICLKKMAKGNLKQHQVVHSNERPFKCDVCNYSFRLKACLDRHKATHKNEKMFECTVCSLKFKTELLMIKHKASHLWKTQYECQFCNLKTLDKGFLYVHYRTVHFDLLREQDRLNGGLNDFFQDVRTYECYKCKYSTYNNCHFKRHVEACEIGSKFMKCPECILKFESNEYLIRHMTKIHPTTT